MINALSMPRAVVTAVGVGALIAALRRDGYRVIGPTLRDQAIVVDTITTLDDLPRGWTDHQEVAGYRLQRRDDAALFGYALGPQGWKRLLHPPVQPLWQMADAAGEPVASPPETERLAFLGVRACELRAIAIQDRVFLGGAARDPHYAARRAGLFVIAVNCGTAGGNCFCVSMASGPRVESGFDLALTELLDEATPRYLVECGSDNGAKILATLPKRDAEETDLAAARAISEATRASMRRAMPAGDHAALLRANPTHPRWDEVARRCLTCGNCTAVCPTCFCTAISDQSDITGRNMARERRWDSCFTSEFSFIHGGSVRSSGRSRYRQWLTHKLSTWVDQFGSSGCVGCGRCITWCPVGIDLTEEVRAIAANPMAEEARDDNA